RRSVRAVRGGVTASGPRGGSGRGGGGAVGGHHRSPCRRSWRRSPSVGGDRFGGGGVGDGDTAGRDLERADPVDRGGHSLPGVIERDEVSAAVLPDALEELDVLGCVAGRDPSALVHVAEQRREVLDAEVRGEIPRPTGSVVVSGGGGPSGHGSVHIGADGLGPG